jgi:hypothetical protein
MSETAKKPPIDHVGALVANNFLQAVLYYVDISEDERRAIRTHLAERVCPDCSQIIGTFFDAMTRHAEDHRSRR